VRRAIRLCAGPQAAADGSSSLSLATGTGTDAETRHPQPPQLSIEKLQQRRLALRAEASQLFSKSTKLDAQVARTKAELDTMLASLIKGLSQHPAVSMQLETYSDLLLQVIGHCVCVNLSELQCLFTLSMCAHQ
jgi:hypothetical protein